ncbi:hypothetical protein [Bartonella sp. ML69XJBT]|uniref:hypothetical protein n=1 Tax=Bartonella sp. ML69XJBT TaxID=3019092 RepID=UPI00235F50E0|nr:hypothetical protein [Bartonella sp. ML69XJBT]
MKSWWGNKTANILFINRLNAKAATKLQKGQGGRTVLLVYSLISAKTEPFRDFA